MSLHRRLLILLAFFTYGDVLFAQGGISWEQATPICDPTSTSTFISLPAVEDYDKTMYPSSIEPCNSYFSFNLNNPAWYTLQTTSTTISMDISIANCVGTGHGVGIQFALVEVIDGEPVPVNCNSNANVDNDNNFTVTDLTVGSTYYLVLDGFAESVCQYSISNSVGFDNPDITETLAGVIVNDSPNNTTGCRVNGVVKVSAVNAANNPIANANVYEWEISNTSGGGFSIIETTSSNSIEIENIPPGDYQAIVKPGNACDGTQATSTFNFTVDPNPIIELDFEPVCLDELSDNFIPSDTRYIGGPLTGLPSNPTRDTFYVEIPGGNCPDIQLIPLEFVNGNNTPSRTIDTTTCSPLGVMIDGRNYGPRAVGSNPHFISQGGACANTVELFVTLFFADGEIAEEKCNNGLSTLRFEPFFIENFNDVKQFASYTWFDESGNVVSNEETYPVTTSGSYSLQVALQSGSNNPPCIFDIPELFVDVSGLSDLEVECDDPTSNSISIQWNDIQDVDRFAVAVEGRVIEDNLSNPTYTYNDITLGETVNFFVFAIGDDPNCPPLMDSISCQALDCPAVDLLIENIGIADDESISICLSEDQNVLADVLEFQVNQSGGAGGGRGRWLISSGGVLGADDEAGVMVIDPNDQQPGEYVLSYRYQEGECRYRSENVKYIEIIRQPISTSLRRRGRLDISDGVCINDMLRLDYNGRAGSNATAVWGGDLTNADVTGDLDDGFQMTFTTPGTKNFTFMITDANGCNSEVAPYTIEVGEPLIAQTITCASTAAGMEFTWPDQACVEEYQIFVNGRFETRVNNSSYTYTRAVNGNSYELEVEAISACGCDEIDFSTSIPCMHVFDACDEVTVAITLDSDSLVCLDGGFAPMKQLSEEVTGGSPTGMGTWTVDTGGAAISNTGTFDPIVAGVGSHLVSYIWTEDACVYEDSLRVFVSEQITYGISSEDAFCFGETMGSISVNPQGGSGEYSILIDFVPQDASLGIYPVDTGEHLLLVIDTITGCDTTTLIQIGPGPDSLNLFPASEYFVLDGDSLQVNLDPDFAATINMLDWTFNGLSLCSDISCGETFILNPTESGLLCFTASYSDICTYTECAQVEYFPEFKIYKPNIITTSADNPVNQTFEVYTSDDRAVVNLMLIYDRWGNNVYENRTEGNSMSWNPSASSKSFTQGVYAYYIEITKGDGERIVEKGTLTVIR